MFRDDAVLRDFGAVGVDLVYFSCEESMHFCDPQVEYCGLNWVPPKFVCWSPNAQ